MKRGTTETVRTGGKGIIRTERGVDLFGYAFVNIGYVIDFLGPCFDPERSTIYNVLYD